MPDLYTQQGISLQMVYLEYHLIPFSLDLCNLLTTSAYFFRLDCCVGSSNLRWYVSCLFFSAIAFIYGSNLTMTSVCHPFILIGTILLPDDCSDVYHQLEYVFIVFSNYTLNIYTDLIYTISYTENIKIYCI